MRSYINTLTFTAGYFTAIGCSDPDPPKYGWLIRDNEGVTMGCNYSEHEWRMSCDGFKWVGTYENCSNGEQNSVINFSAHKFVRVHYFVFSRGWKENCIFLHKLLVVDRNQLYESFRLCDCSLETIFWSEQPATLHNTKSAIEWIIHSTWSES